jgi:1-acyl-sn-glycerol-3-phosphate acyltransferase
MLFILLLTPVLLHFSLQVQFDSDMMNLNYLSPRMKQAQDEVSKANAAALGSVFLVANGKDEDGALQKLETLSSPLNDMEAKGWVRSSRNPTLLLPSKEEQQKRIDRWNKYWTPERKSAIIAEVNAAAQTEGYNVNAFDKFSETLNKNYTPFDTTTNALLKSFFPGSFAFDKSTYYAIVALRVPQQFRDKVFNELGNQKEGFIVFIALLIGYGRIELTLISFLPMAISWIWILGLMALFGLKFNIVNVIISTLIFGLGDDYTIFTMDGLTEKYKHGTQKFTSVRAAVYISAVTTIIGLGVLLLAKHPALRSIAAISVTGIFCVVIISQTLQPFLFNWFIQRRADKGYLPFTLRSFFISVFAFTYFFVGSWILTILGIFFTKLWPFNKEKGKYYFHIWISRFTWSMMYVMANTKKRVHNLVNNDFSKPAVYIANHASFLDILVTTMLHPKLVLLTNKWVWRSPVFGAVVRMAEYYPVAEGAEGSMEPLKSLVDRGYSILVFPEGTRSYDDKIKRFHKGAFFIAEKLGLDVVPIILQGVQYTMEKGDWLLKDGTCSVYVYPPIKKDDLSFGSGYTERTKLTARWMRKELALIKEKNETPKYFKEQLVRSYLYKGPVLEWYCKIKTRLEDYYEQFHTLFPREGKFYDLGCGYGFMTYMLHWAAPERNFTGVDYDEDKIETAQHNFLRDEGINFETADVTKYELESCDGIIISDVLHYLLPEEQNALLEKCVKALKPGGKLIVRDGVAELEERHEGTKLTEKFSTKYFGFNKTRNELHFITQASIEEFSHANGLSFSILDLTKRTSNLIFVLQKPNS